MNAQPLGRAQISVFREVGQYRLVDARNGAIGRRNPEQDRDDALGHRPHIVELVPVKSHGAEGFAAALVSSLKVALEGDASALIDDHAVQIRKLTYASFQRFEINGSIGLRRGCGLDGADTEQSDREQRYRRLTQI